MNDLRRALVNGALVILPIGAVALLVLGIVRRLQDAADPLSGRFVHPALTAVVLLVLLCLVIGFLIRSAAGRWTRHALETLLFEKIPGYRLAKAFAGDGPLVAHGGKAMRPALAVIEEGQCPALVMDEFADGRLLVFVPGSPAPMSGAIYIFTSDKVTLLDVPLLPFMKAIASWGLGLREMIEGVAPTSAPPRRVLGGGRMTGNVSGRPPQVGPERCGAWQLPPPDQGGCRNPNPRSAKDAPDLQFSVRSTDGGAAGCAERQKPRTGSVRFQSDFRGASQAAAPGGAAADLGPVDDDGRKMNFSSRDGWHASRGPASTPLMLTDRVF